MRIKVGDGDWQGGGIHPQARKIVLAGLTPGTTYQIQVRALGGRTGYSNWSMTATKMAT